MADNEFIGLEITEDGGDSSRLEDLTLTFYSNDMEYQLSIDCNGFFPSLDEYHFRDDNDKGYYTVNFWITEDNMLALNIDLLNWYDAFEGQTEDGLAYIKETVLQYMNECSRLFA